METKEEAEWRARMKKKWEKGVGTYTSGEKDDRCRGLERGEGRKGTESFCMAGKRRK
jgi:hypothetical protein